MQTVEIRPNKKRIKLFMGLIVLGMIGATVYIFTSDKYANVQWMKFLYVGLNVYLAFSLYRMAKQFKENKPALTITRNTISFNERNDEQHIKWKDIQDISVIWEDSTAYLKLLTESGEKKVAISWLEKMPSEIETLVKEYQSRAVTNSGLASVGHDE